MSMAFTKVRALTNFKTRELFKNKGFLVGLLLPIGMVLIYRFGLAELFSNEETRAQGFSILLRLGVLLSISMIALTMSATLLAKDKEKHTLRTLMTASVSGMDYFVSSIIPIVVTTVLTNVGILIFSGIPLNKVNLFSYFLAIAIAAFAMSIIGMVIGIFSKNQMAASNNMVFFMMIFMMIPIFSDLFEGLKPVNQFLFTGILADMTTEIAYGNPSPLTYMDWGLLVGSCILLFICFIVVYQKNGFDRE
ncbi:hypothetical protein B835_2007 [Enterococcus mundtii 3F]|uniref:ABC transporter permease n=1 Tax=Enterococcus mundtii TaxID=53346 RepID=UPI0023048A27|nr:ABC transporter permease [Enterococcus mundtii]MDA9462079.1 hypothetical protein [Enterococcus mundtii 3F]